MTKAKNIMLVSILVFLLAGCSSSTNEASNQFTPTPKKNKIDGIQTERTTTETTLSPTPSVSPSPKPSASPKPTATVKKIVNNPPPPLKTTQCKYSCSGPDRDCADFSTHNEAQAFFNCCGFTRTNDPMKLDGLGVDDGLACESLP